MMKIANTSKRRMQVRIFHPDRVTKAYVQGSLPVHEQVLEPGQMLTLSEDDLARTTIITPYVEPKRIRPNEDLPVPRDRKLPRRRR